MEGGGWRDTLSSAWNSVKKHVLPNPLAGKVVDAEINKGAQLARSAAGARGWRVRKRAVPKVGGKTVKRFGAIKYWTNSAGPRAAEQAGVRRAGSPVNR
eukprot:COSAG02_NODE_4237_length_5599_cov_6.352000_1_plen_99_part_00